MFKLLKLTVLLFTLSIMLGCSSASSQKSSSTQTEVYGSIRAGYNLSNP